MLHQGVVAAFFPPPTLGCSSNVCRATQALKKKKKKITISSISTVNFQLKSLPILYQLPKVSLLKMFILMLSNNCHFRLTFKEIPTSVIFKQLKYYTYWDFDKHLPHFQPWPSGSQYYAFKTQSQNCSLGPACLTCYKFFRLRGIILGDGRGRQGRER